MDAAAPLEGAHADLIVAAASGAATARALAALAADLTQRLDRDDPLATQDVLQSIAVLTKMTNEAAALARALIPTARRDRDLEKEARPRGIPAVLDSGIAAGLVADLSARRDGRKA